MSLPSQHRALVVVEKGYAAFRDLPLPKFGDDEILVHVRAVALNPTDWKHIDMWLNPGRNAGSDFSGDIVALGSSASSKGFSVGDSVAGFIRGGAVVADNGTFQGTRRYLVTLPELVWRKPEWLPYEDAAPMGGIALSTAVQALHHLLRLPYEPISTPQPILIWAGSTGVGMYAIKLASLVGYKVVTVASKQNWDLVKSLGASAVFDYNGPDSVSQIQKWAHNSGLGPLKQGLDAISEQGSTEKCIAILGEGGKLITLQPSPADLATNGVEVQPILIYSALDRKIAEDFNQMTEWNEKILPAYLESGKLSKGLVPLKVFGGGLDDLTEALDYVRQGKASGQKVVVPFK